MAREWVHWVCSGNLFSTPSRPSDVSVQLCFAWWWRHRRGKGRWPKAGRALMTSQPPPPHTHTPLQTQGGPSALTNRYVHDNYRRVYASNRHDRWMVLLVVWCGLRKLQERSLFPPHTHTHHLLVLFCGLELKLTWHVCTVMHLLTCWAAGGTWTSCRSCLCVSDFVCSVHMVDVGMDDKTLKTWRGSAQSSLQSTSIHSHLHVHHAASLCTINPLLFDSSLRRQWTWNIHVLISIIRWRRGSG